MIRSLSVLAVKKTTKSHEVQLRRDTKEKNKHQKNIICVNFCAPLCNSLPAVRKFRQALRAFAVKNKTTKPHTVYSQKI